MEASSILPCETAVAKLSCIPSFRGHTNYTSLETVTSPRLQFRYDAKVRPRRCHVGARTAAKNNAKKVSSPLPRFLETIVQLSYSKSGSTHMYSFASALSSKTQGPDLVKPSIAPNAPSSALTTHNQQLCRILFYQLPPDHPSSSLFTYNDVARSCTQPMPHRQPFTGKFEAIARSLCYLSAGETSR
jgi:hypothetical protein